MQQQYPAGGYYPPPPGYPVRRIESWYQPHELRTASPGQRLGAYLLDQLAFVGVIFAAVILVLVMAGAGGDVGLGLGFLVAIAGVIAYIVYWFMCMATGQSPAKRWLKMYVLKGDGSRAGFGAMFVREILVKGIVTGILSSFTIGIYSLIAQLWCLWDRDTQCLWDKMGGTYVAHSPNGFKPFTAQEAAMYGHTLPAYGAAAPRPAPGYAPPPPPPPQNPYV